jgi:hypothetical protein
MKALLAHRIVSLVTLDLGPRPSLIHHLLLLLL